MKIKLKKIIEIDELYSYTALKNITYIIAFVTREPKQVVYFDIAYHKSENIIQNIADNLVKARFYFSDANLSYQMCVLFCQTFLFS